MGWEVFADSDEQVRDFTHATLRLSDLEVLCEPHDWMTDSLIHYGVTEFIGREGQEDERRPSFPKVMWIQPSLVAAAKDGNNEAFDNSIGARLGPVKKLDDA